MKRFLLVCLAVFPLLFSGFTAAYPESQTPQIPGGYTVVVKDLLVRPQPFTAGSKISVGIRLAFQWVAKVTTLPSQPGPKSSPYVFQLPTGAPCKLMSLRLQGLLLSPTEVNLLEYYGPTSMFPADYSYGGFQIVGFCVTAADLKQGFKDIWGWSTASPLACRDFRIVVDLDANPQFKNPMAGVHMGLDRQWRAVPLTTAPRAGACTFQQK